MKKLTQSIDVVSVNQTITLYIVEFFLFTSAKVRC